MKRILLLCISLAMILFGCTEQIETESNIPPYQNYTVETLGYEEAPPDTIPNADINVRSHIGN